MNIFIGIIVCIVILFILFRLFVGIFGNWRMTLNGVITSYIAYRQMHPNETDEEVFRGVLDVRYNDNKYDVGKLMTNMVAKKDFILNSNFDREFKFNLPNLIFTCLAIENNSVVSSKSEEILVKEITQEVARQGFQKYV